MNASSVDENVFERIEQAIMQIGWLGQRQFMQLLSDARFDLTVPQFHTLLYLNHCDGECKMSDLARSTHQSAASLTGVVDRLVEKQLGMVVQDFREISTAVEKLLVDATFGEFRRNVSAYKNDAIFEIPLILDRVMVEKTIESLNVVSTLASVDSFASVAWAGLT